MSLTINLYVVGLLLIVRYKGVELLRDEVLLFCSPILILIIALFPSPTPHPHITQTDFLKEQQLCKEDLLNEFNFQ